MSYINRDKAIAYVEEQYRLFRNEEEKQSVVEGCVESLKFVPVAEVIVPDKLKKLLERKYGDLDNPCGCNVNGQWLSVAAIVELIEQAVKE